MCPNSQSTRLFNLLKMLTSAVYAFVFRSRTSRNLAAVALDWLFKSTRKRACSVLGMGKVVKRTAPSTQSINHN